MVCQVKTRTTVIAGCRPVGGRVDSFKDLEENTGLSTPLLSRFDLVFIITDSREAELDELRADFILNRMWTNSSPALLRSLVDQVKDLEVTLPESILFLIRTYYEYARHRLEQLTVRHLESLLRLVQAHAKLCGRMEACELDALSVLILMESTARGCGLVTCTSPDICFQSEELFAEACEEVKARLGDLESN
jgi:DNA helicase MCM9